MENEKSIVRTFAKLAGVEADTVQVTQKLRSQIRLALSRYSLQTIERAITLAFELWETTPQRLTLSYMVNESVLAQLVYTLEPQDKAVTATGESQ